MPITVARDDYVILPDSASKKKKGKLVRVTRSKDGNCKGVIVDSKMNDADEAKYVEFMAATDVLAMLGPNPTFGTIYGTKVELYFGHSKTKLGDLLYWRALKQEERVRVEKLFTAMHKRLREDKLLLGKEVIYTIRENEGTRIGHYSHSAKKEKPDELCLQAEHFSKAKKPMDELVYLFCHEYMHGLWFTRMSPELQGDWVKAYSRNVTLARVKSDQVEKIREVLVESQRVIDCNKELDDEDKEAFKECLRYLKRIHSLLPRHVNALLIDGDDLTDYWPKSGVALQRKQVIISDYALKNPDEFACEAFGFWYSDYKPVPKHIIKLLEKTVKVLRATSGDVHTQDLDDDKVIDDD